MEVQEELDELKLEKREIKRQIQLADGNIKEDLYTACDLCNTGTERKRRISCDSGPCMGGAEFFSDGYPVQERPGWNGRYSTDLYQYPAITYSYMVR